MIEAIPSILEYGLTGLAALLAFFAYMLLKQESHHESPKDSMLKAIKGFMSLSIALAIIALISSGIDAYANMKRDERESNVNNLRSALHRMAVESIESRLRETSDKQGPDISYRRVKQSVFLNMMFFATDGDILKKALTTIVNRGFGEIKEDDIIPRLLAELPQLRREKLRWLQDKAIPALRSAMEERPPMVQNEVEAKVPLPRDIWILDHDEGDEPYTTVGDLSSLEFEVDLLKANID